LTKDAHEPVYSANGPESACETSAIASRSPKRAPHRIVTELLTLLTHKPL